MPISMLVFVIILFIVAANSIRVIKEYQRAAIFRLGHFMGVRGPGLIWIVPMVDKAQVIDLNQWVPDWQGLSKGELDDRVKSVALSRPEN